MLREPPKLEGAAYGDVTRFAPRQAVGVCSFRVAKNCLACEGVEELPCYRRVCVR
jgi:hypothetical protein